MYAWSTTKGWVKSMHIRLITTVYMTLYVNPYHFHAVMVHVPAVSSSSSVCNVFYTHSLEFMHVRTYVTYTQYHDWKLTSKCTCDAINKVLVASIRCKWIMDVQVLKMGCICQIMDV